jgi:hypothetical protein
MLNSRPDREIGVIACTILNDRSFSWIEGVLDVLGLIMKL